MATDENKHRHEGEAMQEIKDIISSDISGFAKDCAGGVALIVAFVVALNLPLFF